MKTFDIPAICPFCGDWHECATSFEKGGRRPVPGDLTICIECGEWAFFDMVPGGLRKPHAHEYEAIAADELCRLAREAWVAMRVAVHENREATKGHGNRTH